MKTFAAVAIAVALSATSASAQATINVGAPQTNSVFGVDPIVRFTVAFRTAVAISETQSMTDAKTAETVRRTLYGMAEGECAVLSEIFKAECRLNSLAMLPVLNAVPMSTMGATAIYELKPRGAASAR